MSNVTSAQEYFDRAAAPTLERIRRDREKAPDSIDPLLAYLEKHLFLPELDANQLKRACGVRDNSVPILFHDHLGLPPYAYIEDCRLEIACRLLAHSPLKVWQIGQFLGYSTLQVFSRAFNRWAGIRPSVYRKKAREKAGPAAAEALAIAEVKQGETISLSLLRKAARGGLSRAEADELAVSLAELYPKSFAVPDRHDASEPSQSSEPPDGSGTERENPMSPAEAWKLLADRPWDEQRGMLRRGVRLASVDFYHFLRRKSRIDGRKDRQRGLQLAELAVDCLDTISLELSPSKRDALTAQGWAWVANAHRLRRDFVGAEKGFARAEVRLEEVKDPQIEAELYLFKAFLRIQQRRFGEAESLLDRAGALCGRETRSALRAQILLGRAHFRYSQGVRLEDGLRDVLAATELLESLDEPYILATAYQILAVFLIKLGQPQKAARYLPRFKALLAELEMTSHFVPWTEGLLAQHEGRLKEAERCLLETRRHLLDVGASFDEAFCALDLAILYTEAGHHRDVTRLVMEMIPIFESIQVEPEALMAIRLLRKAMADDELDRKALEEVRASFLRLSPGSQELR